MKAVGFYRYLSIDEAESLLDLTVSVPQPKPHDLLVKVSAISVNPVDTKQRSPKEKLEKEPRILGYDAVGEVVEVGEQVTLFQKGDKVYFAGDVTRQGSNAAYTLIDERLAALKPEKLSDVEAAAMPLTTLTAWEALFDRLGIKAEKDSGKTILIINGAGGVGSIATQLAKLAGLEVLATASREETIEWTKRHGATTILDHHQSLPEQLERQGRQTVDYILCLHDTTRYFDVMQEMIAPEGKICSIVELTEPVSMSLLKDKSATFVNEFMFTRAKYQTDTMIRQHEILTKAAHLFDKGELVSTVHQVLEPFNAATMKEAHRILEEGRSIGKLVVKGFDENE
ncbi:zinc-binding alcohol dehydrogenase family protein [Listeria costaricensis]|uniref:zinc-binding alcohol dehydrogenase family protein n=1 Tax=Listeria costaricensis TaxID=2026604 RepID=UPI000C073D12|nr:zinc-binding alcohol dehydrogenase family protein [Listeria costaricensis]